jgi:hypothetical protein
MLANQGDHASRRLLETLLDRPASSSARAALSSSSLSICIWPQPLIGRLADTPRCPLDGPDGLKKWRPADCPASLLLALLLPPITSVAIIHAWRVADAGVPDYSAAMRGAWSGVAK